MLYRMLPPAFHDAADDARAFPVEGPVPLVVGGSPFPEYRCPSGWGSDLGQQVILCGPDGNGHGGVLRLLRYAGFDGVVDDVGVELYQIQFAEGQFVGWHGVHVQRDP